MTKEQKEITDFFESWWAIRITVDDLDLDKTYNLFSSKYSKFIVAQEGDGDNTRIHHHILLVCNDSADVIKELIWQVYPLARGNKSIYTKPSRDRRQLAKYTLKEGYYLYKGFTEEFILKTFKCAIAKTDLKKDITQNEDNLVLGNIEMLEFIDRYVNIKVKHNQPLYASHIKAYCAKMGIRAGKLKSRDYSKNIYNSIENEFHTFC